MCTTQKYFSVVYSYSLSSEANKFTVSIAAISAGAFPIRITRKTTQEAHDSPIPFVRSGGSSHDQENNIRNFATKKPTAYYKKYEFNWASYLNNKKQISYNKSFMTKKTCSKRSNFVIKFVQEKKLQNFVFVRNKMFFFVSEKFIIY